MNNPLSGVDPSGYVSAKITEIKPPPISPQNSFDFMSERKEKEIEKAMQLCENGCNITEKDGKLILQTSNGNSKQTTDYSSSVPRSASTSRGDTGFLDGVGQRFSNLASRGQFMTDQQTDSYDAVAMLAFASGGTDGLMDFFRENPPFSGTKAVAEMIAGVGALRLATLSVKGASVTIGGDAAEAFLIKQGVPAHLAPEFVASFQGQITARIVQEGESFIRYSNSASGAGSFVTQKAYSSPSAAVNALYLKPYGNTAAYMQTVTAQRTTVILEGGVYKGSSSARQSFLADWDSFHFGQGVKY